MSKKCSNHYKSYCAQKIKADNFTISQKPNILDKQISSLLNRNKKILVKSCVKKKFFNKKCFIEIILFLAIFCI